MKIIIISVVLLVFLSSVICFLLKKISELVLYFYTTWFILFSSLFIISGDFSFVSESVVNTVSLMFFVLLTLLPVLIFNIVQGSLQKNRFDKRNYYLPATLFLINMFCLLYFGLEKGEDEFTYEVVENVMSYTNYIVILFVFPISTVFYCYKSFKLLKPLPTLKTYKNNFRKLYLTVFVVLYVLYIIIWVFQNYVLDVGFFKTLLKGYYVFYFMVSFYVIYRANKKDSNKEISVNSNSQFDVIQENISLVMKERELYLNSRLTVKQLAEEVGSNEKYVSNLINQRYQMNFSNFVNDFRVKYATKILLDEKYKNFTIEAIGGLSGFSSKSAFNSTFKKVNGITPSEYKKRKIL